MGWLIFTQEKYLVAQFLASVGKQGKDLTFTGRTYLWAYILNIAQSHLWLGVDFRDIGLASIQSLACCMIILDGFLIRHIMAM